MANNVEKIQPSGIFTNYIYKSIPLAFDESMSYYETLCGVLDLLKTQEDVVNNNADLLAELESYVNNYFDNLDVQEEIDNKLDEMVTDGTFDEIINQTLFTELNARLTANEYQTELNREQVHFKKYDLSFDVTNANVGDLVTAHSTNDVPQIEGYTIVGYLPYSTTYPDANFIIATDISNNKIYSVLELGYKGSDTVIYATGYIIYVKTALIDTTPIT